MRDLQAKARGKWTGILTTLGVPAELLSKRHQPCPFCGGTDRFRYTDKDAEGMYICNQCGAGDGFTFLQKYLDIPIADVFKKVEEICTSVRSDPPKINIDAHANLVAVLKTEAVKDQLKQLTAYFHGRGIDLSITGKPRLKIVKDLKYINNGKTEILFAMLAQVQNKKGELTSVHRTYFGAEGPKRKLMTPVGTITGSAIRLYPEEETLALAEGIETAMAVRQLFKGKVPVWACVSAHGLEHVMLTNKVKNVIVCCDNDKNFTGQAAGYSLAQRLVREGKNVKVRTPEKGDWNDALGESNEI